ncbi:MAG: hypothetical protein Q9219_002109 [cf. Caloplaca sp. 3 TL-2023]
MISGSTGSKGPSSAFESPTFGENASFRLDKPVGSASISPCGRDIVLASRQGLHVIDLDSPWSPPRHLAHQTPWEVADVQWSPFAARDYWVVSTSNQKALVWNLAMIDPQASIEHYLHAHSRAITDINFSAHHPDILATCAVDSYVHCWDLRRPSRAAMTFCDWFAGATQVKWNRQDPHILASSHDKFLRIWDDRKGAYPLRSIEAHATKIYGVDWNRTETNRLATCSLDKTIKFWDYSSDSDHPVSTIRAPFPVWRARHTPFGAGLLAMPQRGDHDLHLYDRQQYQQSQQLDSMPMVHRFDGHEGPVKEFLWRARGSVQNSRDSRDFQLISWGSDRMLRLYRLDDELLAKVGHIRGQVVERTIPFTRRNAEYKSFREDPATNTSTFEDSTISQRSFLDLPGNTAMSGAGMRRQSFGIGGMWATGANAQSSMLGRKSQSKDDSNAISWMRGVKIGKRGLLPPGLARSEASTVSLTQKTNQPWDTFDSLAEEITHLADTFGKVTFEEINMHDRQIVVSLHGPFGSEGSSVYTKCRMDIPSDYPNDEPVWVTLERTAGIGDETILQATSDLQLIAYAYRERQRHSLEALLRYLLGEQSYDDILALLKARPDQPSFEIDQQVDFMSSDEDEAEEQYANDQVLGLESVDGILAVSNAQYNVPLPKACGALWADDGRLVCFFPPKEEKKASFLEPFSFKAAGLTSRTRRDIFEGFGRLHSRSSDTELAPSNRGSVESGDSDFAESLESDSDSSSSSGFGQTSLRLMPSIAWGDGPPEAHRALSTEESQKSSGANAQNAVGTRSSQNFVSIHQYAGLLPAKRHLAEAYSLASSSECCLHNATVARNSGDLDLADTWAFVSLLLKNAVPLEYVPVTFQQEPILLTIRRTLSPLRGKDSAVDLSYDEESQTSMKGPVFWGSHPFGRRWLVDALFEHYERLADIQMLAMLSCVLQQRFEWARELATDNPLEVVGHQSSTWHEAHPLTTAERYFPTAEVASSLLSSSASKPTFSLDMQSTTSGPNSTGSSFGASTSDPLTPFSTGLTPPCSKTNKLRHERSISQAPLSTSPEQLRHTHRSSSNLASAFAASIARPFSFSTPDSSSPPTIHPKRRTSPGSTHLFAGNMQPTLGLPATPGQTEADMRVVKPRSTAPTSGEYKGTADEQRFSFSTKLKNQDQFHNEGYAPQPLLHPSKEKQYAAYRAAYASMLLTWELPVASCVVLQYNSDFPIRPEPQDNRNRNRGGANPLVAVERDSLSQTSAGLEDLRLDVCMREIVDNVYASAKGAISSAPPNDAYLRWDATGVEKSVPNEEAKMEEVAEIMNKMQKHNFDKHRHAFRATHVKTQGIVKGTLTIPPELPQHLAQGLFAHPGTYPVCARYANEPVFLQPDNVTGPRGLGLKVFGCPSDEARIADVPGNGDLNTQDFLFNNAPMLELTKIDTTLDIMSTREKHFDKPVALSAATKLRKDALKQNAPGMLPNTNIISHSFFTQSAFRFGDYYGHLALFPLLDSQKSLRSSSQNVSSSDPSTILSDWLFEYFQHQPAKYEFKIQLGTDPAHHPTEDASVVWDEATAPYQTIGTLEFPVQNSFDQERRVFWEDRMRLDPWRGLEAHRPLGSVNRVRKSVYARSAKQRDELNARNSCHVTDVNEIP